MVKVTCSSCKKEFSIFLSRLKEPQKYIYCSRRCMGDHRKELGIKPPSMLGKKRPKHSKRMSGKNSPFWKGGRYTQNGYLFILKPKHPFANKDGYIREHRLVMEKKIDRYLFSTEIVHHLNHDKLDNRPENLIILGRVDHNRHHLKEYKDRGLPHPSLGKKLSKEVRKKMSEAHKHPKPIQ